MVKDVHDTQSFNSSDEGSPELDMDGKINMERLRRMAGRKEVPYQKWKNLVSPDMDIQHSNMELH